MKLGDQLFQAWRMRIAARWIPRGSRILDVGCHQGELFKYLGDAIKPSVGIDPLASAKNQPFPHEILSIQLNDNLSLKDGSFDVMVLLATIEHITDKSMVAREAMRLLRPHGRVVITVPSREVDKILDILIHLKLVDGMSLDEHHGFNVNELAGIFESEGLKLKLWKKFQLGLNNLFVFERP
jgi:2-polyprenyl-3-methyl-5-hydroxy-6-metoxy-1,4-benzoquinol methylase